jgi:similar to stage IV sporulation protein
MLRIYRFALGYLKIKVFGERPEGIINLCMKEGLSIWGIERFDDYIIISISTTDYLRLFSLRKNLAIKPRIKIIKKTGAWQCVRKVKNRFGVVVGICLFLALNIFLSTFIWDVKIVGNEEVDENTIIKLCSDSGLDIGVRKGSVDVGRLKQIIPLEIKGIAWSSVNVEGSFVTVNISESKESVKKDDTPSNIIASCDGVIKSIEVVKGEKTTEVGKVVVKGELLVSGVVNFGDKQKLVSGDGIVLAETHHKYVFNIGKTLGLSKVNGKKDNRNMLYFFGIKIPLYLKDVNSDYKSFVLENYLSLNGKRIPIGLISKAYIYEDSKIRYIGREEAEILALQKLSEAVRNEDIISVDNYEVIVVEHSENYMVTVKTICLENIGEKQIINTDSSS